MLGFNKEYVSGKLHTPGRLNANNINANVVKRKQAISTVMTSGSNVLSYAPLSSTTPPITMLSSSSSSSSSILSPIPVTPLVTPILKEQSNQPTVSTTSTPSPTSMSTDTQQTSIDTPPSAHAGSSEAPIAQNMQNMHNVTGDIFEKIVSDPVSLASRKEELRKMFHTELKRVLTNLELKYELQTSEREKLREHEREIERERERMKDKQREMERERDMYRLKEQEWEIKNNMKTVEHKPCLTEQEVNKVKLIDGMIDLVKKSKDEFSKFRHESIMNHTNSLTQLNNKFDVLEKRVEHLTLYPNLPAQVKETIKALEEVITELGTDVKRSKQVSTAQEERMKQLEVTTNVLGRALEEIPTVLHNATLIYKGQIIVAKLPLFKDAQLTEQLDETEQLKWPLLGQTIQLVYPNTSITLSNQDKPVVSSMARIIDTDTGAIVQCFVPIQGTMNWLNQMVKVSSVDTSTPSQPSDNELSHFVHNFSF